MTTPPRPAVRWPRRLCKELLEPILFAVLVTQFGFTLVGVDGASMMPALRDGERVFIPKYETWLHKLGVGRFQRGDIIVFKPPAAAHNTRTVLGWTYRPFLIKRLIGLPGDTIRVAGGLVFVNGREVAQGFTTDYWRAQGCWDTRSDLATHAQSAGLGVVREAKSIRLAANQYFVMGDNRSPGGSQDSRLFGPVALSDIAGRGVAVVWPLVRRADAQYDCTATVRPQDHVRFTGTQQLNLRRLARPAAFGALPQDR